LVVPIATKFQQVEFLGIDNPGTSTYFSEVQGEANIKAEQPPFQGQTAPFKLKFQPLSHANCEYLGSRVAEERRFRENCTD